MSNPTASKRQRESGRQDRAKRKQQRRVERLEAAAEQVAATPAASEREVIVELARLHSGFADGSVSPEAFESAKAELAHRLRTD